MIMTSDTVLGIAAAALGLLGLAAALFMIRALRATRARCRAVESSLAAVRRELDLVASISMKTGSRLKRMEQEYSGVADRVDLVELRGAAQSFDQAIESGGRGAAYGELTQQFGLSRSEADLMTRLHGRKKSA
jgi:hypothetical protein